MIRNQKAIFALGRLPVGEMNRLETAYDLQLKARLHAGEILWYKFNALKLRLADNTFYTVDFVVMDKNCELSCHECKGFMMEDANVKIKVAAAAFPLRFYVIKAQAKKNGGGFSITEV